MPQRTPGDPYDQYHKGDAPFQFPLWAIIAGFVTFWPLGIFFIIANSFLRTAAGTPLSNSAAASGTPLYARGTPPQTVKGKADQTLKAATGKVADKADNSSSLPTVLFIAGAVLLLVGIVAVGEPIGDALIGVPLGAVLEDLFAGLAFLGGGIASLCAGFSIRTSARMRKKIDNIVGNADHMYIKDIAAAIPCSEEKCRKHLENCIDKGLFGDDAYLDMRTKCLVVRGPAPQPEQKAKPKAKTRPAPAAAKDGDRYQQILDELHKVNEAIPDDEMSSKISRLETVSERIFRQARANPDKLPQMRKFMDYYLPTALKLLKTYAELDAQGVEGDNIRLSKQRIEQAMNTLVVAFENQLDQLFRADAMDVSADIEVMENMLRADGLAGEQPLDLPSPPAAPPAPRLEL